MIFHSMDTFRMNHGKNRYDHGITNIYHGKMMSNHGKTASITEKLKQTQFCSLQTDMNQNHKLKSAASTKRVAVTFV